MSAKAIFNLYPQVFTIDEGVGAFDINGNKVEIDQSAVDAKTLELQAEELIEKQAVIDTKQSALNKLMALGLTEEEALALGVK